MDLRSFLRLHKIKQKELAKVLGLSVITIRRTLQGLSTPRLETALRISELTGGAVSVEEILDIKKKDKNKT